MFYDFGALTKGPRMVLLGYILLAFGLIVGLYGEVRFLVVAYNRNLWWFFGCLFVPLVSWVFLLLNFKATIKPFGLSLLGLLLAGLGCWMAGVVWPR
jgi:hypothetical protein